MDSGDHETDKGIKLKHKKAEEAPPIEGGPVATPEPADQHAVHLQVEAEGKEVAI
jgi:hypothetical protein